MNLAIVESPGKIKKIQEYLGSDYQVIACYGHCIDLDPKKISVDIKKDFGTKFVVLDDKKDVVENIQKRAEKAKTVYLFMDTDREGEGMARNLSQILPKGTKWKRGRFQAITKTEIQEAIKNAGDIDHNMVNSYECRRILDRLCGYKTSYLTTMATGGQSAGRVQSAILRIIVDREKEILAFIPVEYWIIAADFLTQKKEKYSGTLDDKITVSNEHEAQKIYDAVIKGKPAVSNVESKEHVAKPYAPFTTGTMIQAASTILGWNAKTTMSAAQSLYEMGKTTYLRTDSTYMSSEAVDQIRGFIGHTYAKPYLPKTANVYQSKKGSQEAHECVRVTDVSFLPNNSELTGNEKKLYNIIWKRSVACQMTNGNDLKTKITTTVSGYDFITRGSITVFDGFRKVWDYSAADDVTLPVVAAGDKCTLENLTKDQKWTQPPSRYSDASLSKKCEQELISRPATFASSIQTLYSRKYIEQHNKSFRPTELGIRVVDFLTKANFCFVDIKFTSSMEQLLDDILENKQSKLDVLTKFWDTLKQNIENGKSVKTSQQETNYTCEKCGAKLLAKHSKFGPFYSCSNYKKTGGCDFIATVGEGGQPVPKVVKEKEYATFECNKCGSKMVKRESKHGAFYGCQKFPYCRSVAGLDGTFKEATGTGKKFGKSKWKKKSKSDE